MRYCPDCMRLVEARCPRCGTARLRSPAPGDPVHVARLDYVAASLFAQRLEAEGIAFLQRGVRGAGLIAFRNAMCDDYDFFVPYGALATAEALLAEAEEPTAAPAEEA